jgi:hypothetical protein
MSQPECIQPYADLESTGLTFRTRGSKQEPYYRPWWRLSGRGLNLCGISLVTIMICLGIAATPLVPALPFYTLFGKQLMLHSWLMVCCSPQVCSGFRTYSVNSLSLRRCLSRIRPFLPDEGRLISLRVQHRPLRSKCGR